MASIKRKPNLPQLIGVSNYDKLKSNKAADTINPFISQTFNKKAKSNVEATSLDERYLDSDVYNQLLGANGYNQNIRSGKKMSYYGLDLKVRRQQMIRLSVHDVIDDVLTKLCNEVVVTGNGDAPIQLHVKNDILDAQNLKESYRKDVVDYAQKAFKRIVKMYGLEQLGESTSLWNKCWQFLTEGTQAYEMIWDSKDNPKYIIGIHEIDALDTESFYYDGIRFWKHHKSLSMRGDEHVILYDRQVVYIDWSKAQANNRMSYLEHLFKSFNDLRIIDETTINWSITNSTFRQMMTVPTRGLSRTQSAAAVAREMSRWNDEITYDGDTGMVHVNGQNRLQMMKSIYVAEGAGGSPKIENVKGDGPDFSDMAKNEFFEKRFYRAAKMPSSRFDGGSSDTWNIDTRATLREEINFGRFVDKIRQIMKMLIIKPLRTELIFRFPELQKDDIVDAFDLRWNTYNVFDELMQMDIMQEKMGFISDMNDKFSLETPDGQTMKYFSLDFLIEEYLPELTSEKRERNEALAILQEQRLFEYQIKIHQLNAKYNPELRFNDMGAPDTEAIETETTEIVGAPGDYSKMYNNDESDEDAENSDTSSKNLSQLKKQIEKTADNAVSTAKQTTKQQPDLEQVNKDIEQDLDKDVNIKK